jgi:transposase
LVKRLHVLLAVAEGMTVHDVAQMLGLGEQTVRDYLHSFLWRGVASLVYQRPPGRPAKRTQTQRKALATLIEAGPQAAGYASGCWSATMIQDLIQRQFGVEYHPHYICPLLQNLGFSYQKARCVSDHLAAAKRLEWCQQTWPTVLRRARQRKALLLFGDEASFAQWGSLSYTWALKGHQPEVLTRGIRKAYKVFGRIDYFSGRFFSKAHTGRFHSVSYATFLLDVLAQTTNHIFVMQDGARYHTSKAMEEFFAAHATRVALHLRILLANSRNPHSCVGGNHNKSEVPGSSGQFANSIIKCRATPDNLWQKNLWEVSLCYEAPIRHESCQTTFLKALQREKLAQASLVRI